MMKSRCVSTSQKTVRVMVASDSILDGGPGQNKDARRPSPDAREGETDGGLWGFNGEGWPAPRQESRRLLGAARQPHFSISETRDSATSVPSQRQTTAHQMQMQTCQRDALALKGNPMRR